jgi:hypothetical protein
LGPKYEHIIAIFWQTDLKIIKLAPGTNVLIKIFVPMPYVGRYTMSETTLYLEIGIHFSSFYDHIRLFLKTHFETADAVRKKIYFVI